MLLFALAYRLLTGLLLVRTAFSPDEFWQNQEVAYAAVFGEGYLTWEWLPPARIRSFLHPAPTAALYWVLAALGLDGTAVVAWAPRALQACVAALGDYYLYRLALIWARGDVLTAKWALVGQLITWFGTYAYVRPFANSAEAALTVAALYYWGFAAPGSAEANCGHLSASAGASAELNNNGKNALTIVRSSSSIDDNVAADDDDNGAAAADLVTCLALQARARSQSFRSRAPQALLALLLMGLATLLRPSAALLWAPLALLRLATLPTAAARRRLLLASAIPAVIAVITLGLAVDRAYYGVFTASWLNFFRLNVVQDVARLYGTHPWHWMFTAALPTVTGAFLPFVLLGSALLLLPHNDSGCSNGNAFSSSSSAGADDDDDAVDVSGSDCGDGCGSNRGRGSDRGRPSAWLLLPALWPAVVASFSAHKEFRFILASLPPAMAVSGYAIARCVRFVQRKELQQQQQQLKQLKQQQMQQLQYKPQSRSALLSSCLRAFNCVYGVCARFLNETPAASNSSAKGACNRANNSNLRPITVDVDVDAGDSHEHGGKLSRRPGVVGTYTHGTPLASSVAPYLDPQYHVGSQSQAAPSTPGFKHLTVATSSPSPTHSHSHSHSRNPSQTATAMQLVAAGSPAHRATATTATAAAAAVATAPVRGATPSASASAAASAAVSVARFRTAFAATPRGAVTRTPAGAYLWAAHSPSSSPRAHSHSHHAQHAGAGGVGEDEPVAALDFDNDGDEDDADEDDNDEDDDGYDQTEDGVAALPKARAQSKSRAAGALTVSADAHVAAAARAAERRSAMITRAAITSTPRHNSALVSTPRPLGKTAAVESTPVSFTVPAPATVSAAGSGSARASQGTKSASGFVSLYHSSSSSSSSSLASMTATPTPASANASALAPPTLESFASATNDALFVRTTNTSAVKAAANEPPRPRPFTMGGSPSKRPIRVRSRSRSNAESAAAATAADVSKDAARSQQQRLRLRPRPQASRPHPHSHARNSSGSGSGCGNEPSLLGSLASAAAAALAGAAGPYVTRASLAALLLLVAAASGAAAAYFGLWHQSAPIAAMSAVANAISRRGEAAAAAAVVSRLGHLEAATGIAVARRFTSASSSSGSGDGESGVGVGGGGSAGRYYQADAELDVGSSGASELLPMGVTITPIYTHTDSDSGSDSGSGSDSAIGKSGGIGVGMSELELEQALLALLETSASADASADAAADNSGGSGGGSGSRPRGSGSTSVALAALLRSAAPPLPAYDAVAVAASVALLLPCHTTPYRSFLHFPAAARRRLGLEHAVTGATTKYEQRVTVRVALRQLECAPLFDPSTGALIAHANRDGTSGSSHGGGGKSGGGAMLNGYNKDSETNLLKDNALALVLALYGLPPSPADAAAAAVDTRNGSVSECGHLGWRGVVPANAMAIEKDPRLRFALKVRPPAPEVRPREGGAAPGDGDGGLYVPRVPLSLQLAGAVSRAYSVVSANSADNKHEVGMKSAHTLALCRPAAANTGAGAGVSGVIKAVELAPTYIVVFDTVAREIKPFLRAWGYLPTAGSPFFHSHSEDEKEMLVFERSWAPGEREAVARARSYRHNV